MKTRFAVITLAMLFVFAGAAQARSCGPNSRNEILNGLKKLSTDANQSEEKQEAALFAASLIANEQNLKCDFNSGFVGSVYDLTTATHQIHISFAARNITNLQIERIRFN